jgi:hypothetical protein
MSEYLPARANSADQRPVVVSGPAGLERARSWLSSPMGQAALDLVPDVVRWIGRRPHGTVGSVPYLPSSGANGVTVSEVEMDLRVPFVRRVVIRSASSWSIAPEILLAERRQRRGRLGVSLLSIAALAVAGVVAARKSGQLPEIAHQVQRFLPDRASIRQSSEPTE